MDHLFDHPLDHADQKVHHPLDHLVGDHAQMRGLLWGHTDVDQTLVDEVEVYH